VLSRERADRSVPAPGVDLLSEAGLGAQALISNADPDDFIALMKPRVMSLVVFTAFVGLMIAPGTIHPLMAAIAIFAIAVGAGASGALNMWYDADIDAIMQRTLARPIPSGRVRKEEARAFGLFLSALSVMVLGLATNWVAAGLQAFTIFFYVVIYTMWLKRITAQNIVIGGAAGALPPLIGWAAVTGSIALEPIVLFAIIFFWTPPHFWALALVRSQDYARAGIPMLPVTHGERHTKWQILLYSLILFPISLAPYAMGFAGPFYLVVATLGGCAMIFWSVAILRARGEKSQIKACWQMFGGSILQLFAVFAAFLIEALLPLGKMLAWFGGAS
jgi:heme o synthase